MASEAHLFEPAPAYHFGTRATGGEFTAQAYFQAGSPPSGAQLRYWLENSTGRRRGNSPFRISDGNEIQTLTGSKRAGLNAATWNLMGRGTPLPKSPSEVRDSIAIDKRLAFVVDSLAEAGTDRDELDRVVEILRQAPAAGGFGGGRGGAPALFPPTFVERPAEGRATSGGGGARGNVQPGLQQQITQLVRGDQGGRGRRFGGGGGGLFPSRSEPASRVEPGIYTVTMTIGDRTFTQSLKVDRSHNAPSG